MFNKQLFDMNKIKLMALIAFAVWRPFSSFAQAMETDFWIKNQKQDSVTNLPENNTPIEVSKFDTLMCDSFVFKIVSPKDTFLYGSIKKAPMYRIDSKRRVYGVITYGNGIFHLEHLTYGPQSNSYEDVKFYLVNGHWYCYCVKGKQSEAEKDIREIFSYFY